MAKPPNKPPDDYEVGYRRPPRHSQFRSGQSGNPRGRPKGQPTASEIFMRESARLVRIQVGDKVETITKLEAVIRKLFQTGITGDPRAMGMILAAYARLGIEINQASPEEADENILGTVVPDEDALRRMLSRFDYLRPE
jgi:hypothetical protein